MHAIGRDVVDVGSLPISVTNLNDDRISIDSKWSPKQTFHRRIVALSLFNSMLDLRVELSFEEGDSIEQCHVHYG